jgi:hypothetical protein
MALYSLTLLLISVDASLVRVDADEGNPSDVTVDATGSSEPHVAVGVTGSPGIDALKWYFTEYRKFVLFPENTPKGLEASLREFIDGEGTNSSFKLGFERKTFLSYADAVALESMCPGLPSRVGDTALAWYDPDERNGGGSGIAVLTINGVLAKLCNEPISVRFGYAGTDRSWRLYYKGPTSFYLPVCKDGRFYTSHYAARQVED